MDYRNDCRTPRDRIDGDMAPPHDVRVHGRRTFGHHVGKYGKAYTERKG